MTDLAARAREMAERVARDAAEQISDTGEERFVRAIMDEIVPCVLALALQALRGEALAAAVLDDERIDWTTGARVIAAAIQAAQAEREGRMQADVKWVAVADRLPDEGVAVETKIDDANGERNAQPLTRRGRMWWTPDGAMYVYYTPTHWRYASAALDRDVLERVRAALADPCWRAALADVEQAVIARFFAQGRRADVIFVCRPTCWLADHRRYLAWLVRCGWRAHPPRGE